MSHRTIRTHITRIRNVWPLLRHLNTIKELQAIWQHECVIHAALGQRPASVPNPVQAKPMNTAPVLVRFLVMPLPAASTR